jgi:hypothetical protein
MAFDSTMTSQILRDTIALMQYDSLKLFFMDILVLLPIRSIETNLFIKITNKYRQTDRQRTKRSVIMIHSDRGSLKLLASS